jgi:hypothetical protein
MKCQVKKAYFFTKKRKKIITLSFDYTFFAI